MFNLQTKYLYLLPALIENHQESFYLYFFGKYVCSLMQVPGGEAKVGGQCQQRDLQIAKLVRPKRSSSFYECVWVQPKSNNLQSIKSFYWCFCDRKMMVVWAHHSGAVVSGGIQGQDPCPHLWLVSRCQCLLLIGWGRSTPDHSGSHMTHVLVLVYRAQYRNIHKT